MITLQQVEPARHRNVIAAWLETDRIVQWWGDPLERLEEFDAAPQCNHAMIVQSWMPIGYLRWGMINQTDFARIGLDWLPSNSVDVDIFIGPEARSGQGAGPKALSALFAHLTQTTPAALAGLCTSIENARASCV